MTAPTPNDDPVKKAAEHIQMVFATAVYALSSDGELAPDAVQRRIAAAWTRASDDLAALQTQSSGDTETRKAQLQRQVFGTAGIPGDAASLAMSARDASERVAQIDFMDAPAAQALLDRAEVNGDEILARQIAAAAWSNPVWSDVLDSFLARRPAAAQAIGELNTLSNQSLQSSFLTSAQFYLPKPPQIAMLQDWQVRALAAQVQA